jgi:hypothetical protein
MGNVTSIKLYKLWVVRQWLYGQDMRPCSLLNVMWRFGIQFAKIQHFRWPAWNITHFLLRYAGTIICSSIALLQLVYRWQYQSQKLCILAVYLYNVEPQAKLQPLPLTASKSVCTASYHPNSQKLEWPLNKNALKPEAGRSSELLVKTTCLPSVGYHKGSSCLPFHVTTKSLILVWELRRNVPFAQCEQICTGI